MTKYLKIAIVSLAVLGSATTAQAIDNNSFADRFFAELERDGA